MELILLEYLTDIWYLVLTDGFVSIANGLLHEEITYIMNNDTFTFREIFPIFEDRILFVGIRYISSDPKL